MIWYKLCSPRKCLCCVLVGEFGLHRLSCRLSAGRFPRHSTLNDDIIERVTLCSMPEFVATLEEVYFFFLSLSKPWVPLVLLHWIPLQILVVWRRMRDSSRGNANGFYNLFPWLLLGEMPTLHSILSAGISRLDRV